MSFQITIDPTLAGTPFSGIKSHLVALENHGNIAVYGPHLAIRRSLCVTDALIIKSKPTSAR